MRTVHRSPTSRLRLGLAGLLTALVLGAPAIARAADDAEPTGWLEIRGVDATAGDATHLTVAYDGDPDQLASATILDNGDEREIIGNVVPYAAAGGVRAVVIAVDTSEAVDPVMQDLRDTVNAIVDSLPAGTEIGLATFSDRFVPIRNLTDDVARVHETVDSLQANGESALWNGIEGAAGMLANAEPEAQPSVILVTASGNFASTVDEGAAAGELRNQGAPLYVVGLEGDRFDAGNLEDVVERAGGRMFTTPDSEQLDELGTQVAGQIDHQFVLAYEPPSGDDAGAVADLTVRTEDAEAGASFVRGSATTAPADLFRQEVDRGDGGGLLPAGVELYGGILLVLAAVAMATFAVIQLTQSDESRLSNVLEPYADGYVETFSGGADGEADGSLAKTALIQRAVELTEEFAERRGFLARAESALERADLPLRAAEALFFYGAGIVVVGLLALILTGNLLGMAVIGGFAALMPVAAVNFKAKSRLKKFNTQLPDMLQLLAGTLRAGYSLMQGVEAVSREVDDPIGYELRRVVTESRLGRPLEEALDAAAQRIGSADFGWAVMAIGIQREVGGNLAELLMTVSDTMVQRERLRRDVAALTAEGKVSAIVLGFLPVGLAGAMYVINPEYIGLLFSEKVGNFMLMGAVMLAGFGFWWMKKMIEIEV